MARGKVRVTTTPSPIRQQDGTSPHFITPPDLAAAIAAIFPITPAHGGTGLTTYTTGDLIYASGAGTLARLAAVAPGAVLLSAGVGAAPVWTATPTIAGNVTIQGGLFVGSGVVGAVNATITNLLAGPANLVSLIVGTDTINNLNIQGFSSTYTPSGYAFPNGGAIANTGSGGLSFAQTGTGDIRFYTTGAVVLRMKIISASGILSTTAPAWINGAIIGALGVTQAGTSDRQGFVVLSPSNDAYAQIYYDGTSFQLAATYISSEGYKPISIWTHDLERLRVHADGGVSIGNTTSPGLANLSVTGATASSMFQTMTAIVAAGGGAAPTFTTIGGGGPAVAAQFGWKKELDSTGSTIWIPVWK